MKPSLRLHSHKISLSLGSAMATDFTQVLVSTLQVTVKVIQGHPGKNNLRRVCCLQIRGYDLGRQLSGFIFEPLSELEVARP